MRQGVPLLERNKWYNKINTKVTAESARPLLPMLATQNWILLPGVVVTAVLIPQPVEMNFLVQELKKLKTPKLFVNSIGACFISPILPTKISQIKKTMTVFFPVVYTRLPKEKSHKPNQQSKRQTVIEA